MKNSIWTIFVLMVFVQSCITQQKCMERFPPQVATKDTTITVIRDSIVHDTIIVPGEIMFWTDTVPCPELEYHKTVTKNHLTGTLNISNGKLDFQCKTDSLEQIIASLRREKETWYKSEAVKVEKEIQYENHWYTVPSYWIALISLIYLFLLIVLWVVRKVYGSKT